ncbi:ABC transporter permease [Streptomyces sviceus]|uniref:ABC transporter permease n=1 Tax=Streptomyces sviceus TaxID=285530 RepID=UPI003680BFCA
MLRTEPSSGTTAPHPPRETAAPPATRVSSHSNLRAVRVLWQREVTRLTRNPVRLAMGLLTPLLFLVVLGTGMSSSPGSAGDGMRQYRTFLYPGVLLMSVQAPAIAVGISIVWDRKSGLLRQMLVAPVRRGALILGVCLGGAAAGTVYGAMVVALAWVADIPYEPRLLLVLPELALISLVFTSLAVLAAVAMKRIETFQVAVSLGMMPLLFTSGAMFPVGGLPGWLGFAVNVNPLTYAVDAIRRTLPGIGAEYGGRAAGPTWGGWSPPVALELGVIAAIASLAVLGAARRFSRAE